VIKLKLGTNIVLYVTASIVELCGLQGREESIQTGINAVIALQVRISEVQTTADTVW
jgi:hypothetical protein